ncbi:aminopeptidase [Rubrobacter calidifluminis]|uniref:aminopeptidase n=1 Tax=Rubrobacter calidifluminis TaxID=1392640 RepID=UPI0023604E8E|nr:aminopeptidase [Rubrobacter calidifluminis]
MRDERLTKLADVMVRYSIGAREGEQVLITGGIAAAPLIREVYARVLDAGAVPVTLVSVPGLQEVFFEHAGDAHYRKTPSIMRSVYEQADAFVQIMAPENTRALSGVDPEKQRALALRDKHLTDLVIERDRWILTLYPTNALAQESEMGLREYEEFVFSALALDREDPAAFWSARSAEQRRLAERLERGREVRIVGPGTELTLSVEGRRFLEDSGQHNLPCGEIFTGPVEDSAEGHVYFGVPATVGGRDVSGVHLTFHEGRVVEAAAEKGEEYLTSMLDADEGSRYLGELGIGTNYEIPRATRSILFDEKLGGTVHLALGQSYAQTGGRNSSSVHWDLICDLRQGGELYVDGELLQKDGRFVGFDL